MLIIDMARKGDDKETKNIGDDEGADAGVSIENWTIVAVQMRCFQSKVGNSEQLQAYFHYGIQARVKTNMFYFLRLRKTFLRLARLVLYLVWLISFIHEPFCGPTSDKRNTR